ncbi:MAG: hypothetical protein SX243_03970 [Acidobacteriota bacterium]|nr:hypothetical protein [Acidobacteriota bacterium]
MFRRLFVLSLLCLACSWSLSSVVDSSAQAQGRTDYLNVESPQTHPIEVFQVAGQSYLAVVNTPASTLEIWHTDERIPSRHRFITRVRTGLEPVSVRWLPQRKRLYTANFLGDSISVVQVLPGGRDGLRARLVKTTRVTDEPADLAFAPGDGPSGISVFVPHSMLDAYGEYDSRTLEPVAPGSEYIFATVPAGEDIDGLFGPDIFALKHPRSVAAGCGQLFFASMMGGNSDIYDFDIFRRPVGSDQGIRIPGLGTSIFALGFAPGGELLAVGTEARNAELRTEPVVAAADTGFTRSLLHVIEDPCGEAPVVHSRDLNAVPAANLTGGLYAISSTGAVMPDPYQPVAKAEALAQPTDVAAFEADGGITKIFVTGFGSDRIGVLEADTAAAALSWPRRTIDVAPIAGNPMAGPRGLALKPASRRGGPHATGARLYVANRLDNSVTVIDPITETVVETFPLTQDPTPEYIRHGREFLYSANLSGAGFVSCASCHIDGRSDGLAWNLGLDPSLPTTPIPPELIFDTNFFPSEFVADKGWTTTQSLQGLLDWEVDPETQGLFTNAPYHWRGDREDFIAFNVAFDGLMGGSEISAPEMALFEEMINSIHYPPNPRQPLARQFSGSFGDPQDVATGSGGQRGLKIYHSFRPGEGGAETCGHCHVLPIGSDNRITDEPQLNAGHDREFFAFPQPVSTPGLRGMIGKEATVKLDGNPALPGPYAIAGMEGVGITGWISEPTFLPNFNDFADADRFSQFLFGPDLCGAPFVSCPDLQDLLTFVYEMDWGLAPRVGYAVTLHRWNASDAALLAEIQALEDQAAKAYLGVAVQASLRGGETGFWLDVTGATPVYRQEPSGTAWTRSQLLAALVRPFDRLVFQGTPLGDERRLASTTGSAAPLNGPAPANVELLPMAPLDIYSPITTLTEEWLGPEPGLALASFGGIHSHAVRLFQYGLTQDGPPDAFGLPGVQWDAPRLFQVAGEHLRPGAELHLFTHWDDQAGSPPNLSLGPEDANQVLMRRSVLPLYPTEERTADGRVVWKTAIQARTEVMYQLMLGGRFAPGVQDALADSSISIPEPPPAGMFDPVAWNWHYVRVVNADGTQTDAGWARITLQ